MMFPSVALLGACKDTARRDVWVWLTNSSFILLPARRSLPHDDDDDDDDK
jgi:hypothetical protein